MLAALPSASATCSSLGAAPTYQWRKDGVEILGATQNILVFGATAFSDAGVYDVLVTDEDCTVLSDPATLTVQQCP